MSSSDRAVMLEALGWSRGGAKNNHLPDDIVNIIHQFVFFDIRTEAYREHIIKEEIKTDKIYALNHMMFQINDVLKYMFTTSFSSKYGVEYDSINITSNCCTICGEFVPVQDPIPANIRCYCSFITEEEIMDLEYQRQDNDFWEEEQDAERERERRRQNREFDKDFGDDTYSLEDDYSDRKPNWDEAYDYCDDDNSYF